MSSYGYHSSSSQRFDSSASSSTPNYYRPHAIPAPGYPPVDQSNLRDHNAGEIPVQYDPPNQPYLPPAYSYPTTDPMHYHEQPRSSTSPIAPLTWPDPAPFSSITTPSTPFDRSPVVPSPAHSAPSPEVPTQPPLGANDEQFYGQHFSETHPTSSPIQFRIGPPEQMYGDPMYSTAPHSQATAASVALTESLGGSNTVSQYPYQAAGYTGAREDAYAYAPATSQPDIWPAPTQDNPLQMSRRDSLIHAQAQAQALSHSSRHTQSGSGDSSLDYSYPSTPNQPLSQPSSPFRGFPDADTSRDLNYKDPYNDPVNTQLLEAQVQDAPCIIDPRHQLLVPPMKSALPPLTHANIPNPATELVQQRRGRSSPPTQLYFLESTRQNLALWLFQQSWLKDNQVEPPIASVEADVVQRLLAAADSSCRFDLLFKKEGKKGKFKCLWIEDGKPCNHISERQERARGHARFHFNYRPYPCGGVCGRQGCQEQYICQSSRSDHVRRKHKPKRPCPVCHVEFSAQNLRRHTKVHEQNLHEQPGSPSDARPSKRRRIDE